MGPAGAASRALLARIATLAQTVAIVYDGHGILNADRGTKRDGAVVDALEVATTEMPMQPSRRDGCLPGPC